MTTRLRGIFVGEAWGVHEARAGHALVGPSGIELAAMIEESGLGPGVGVKWPNYENMIAYWARLRADFGIGVTNVFNEHPMGNEINQFFGKEGDRAQVPLKAGKYIRPEAMHHVERLWKELAVDRPNLIIAIGNSAAWATLGKTGIGALRGAVQSSKRLSGIKVLPTYHPAAILRQWSLRTIGLADLIKARRELEFPEVRRPKRWLTVISPDSKGLVEGSQWLNRPAPDGYSIDIETNFGQISMLSFARSPADALVIQFHNDDGSSFWPNVFLETEAWKLTQRGLSKPVPKTFQNGLYDISYFMRMGFQVKMCRDDTMLRHHAALPELPKSLGFMGSLYSDECAWKSMRTAEDTLKRDE